MQSYHYTSLSLLKRGSQLFRLGLHKLITKGTKIGNYRNDTRSNVSSQKRLHHCLKHNLVFCMYCAIFPVISPV